MDFEPWLRDQLANRQPDAPARTPGPARLRFLPGIPAFRAGFAGAGVLVVILGLASGRALPGLVLTSPQTRARDIPANTWGGVPSPPPGQAQLAVEQGRGGDTRAPGAGGAQPGAHAAPTASTRSDDDAAHRAAASGPTPAPAAAPWRRPPRTTVAGAVAAGLALALALGSGHPRGRRPWRFQPQSVHEVRFVPRRRDGRQRHTLPGLIPAPPPPRPGADVRRAVAWSWCTLPGVGRHRKKGWPLRATLSVGIGIARPGAPAWAGSPWPCRSRMP